MRKLKNVLSYLTAISILVLFFGGMAWAFRHPKKDNSETFIPRKPDGKDTVWYKDTTYFMSLKIDSSFYDPDSSTDEHDDVPD